MKRKISVFIFLLIIQPLFSQNDTLHLSLDKAWELALDNNLSRLSNFLDRQIAKKELSIARTQVHPQLDAGIDVRYNIEPPIFLLPGETVNQPGEVVIANLASNIGGFPSLRVNQVVFDAAKESKHILSLRETFGPDFKLLGIIFDCKLEMSNAVRALAGKVKWKLQMLLR